MICEKVDFFKKNGYVILKNAIDIKYVNLLLEKTKRLSGLIESDYKEVLSGKKDNYVNVNQPLVLNDEFWPLITNKKVLEFCKCLCSDISFIGFDAIMVHRFATVLHRDSFIKSDNLKGPNFDPNFNEYYNIRAATYLTENEIILIPKSHRMSFPDRNINNFRDFQDLVLFVKLEPGDIVLFDALLLHAGRYITKEKYMLVWNYAAKNKHTLISKYYAQVVTSTTLNKWNSIFINYLKEYDLYWEELWNDDKWLTYFNIMWKDMPKHPKNKAYENKEALYKHWSPYENEMY